MASVRTPSEIEDIRKRAWRSSDLWAKKALHLCDTADALRAVLQRVDLSDVPMSEPEQVAIYGSVVREEEKSEPEEPDDETAGLGPISAAVRRSRGGPRRGGGPRGFA